MSFQPTTVVSGRDPQASAAVVADPDGLLVDAPLPERILAAVESIPRGRVLSYGDVAEYAGGRSGRTVGRVLSQDGGSVPWHRVVRVDGSCAPHLYQEQRQRLLAEGVRFVGARVDMAAHRWDGRTPQRIRQGGRVAETVGQ